MNQINPTYIPPRAGVGAVNIQIFNPTAIPGGHSPNVQYQQAPQQQYAQPQPQPQPYAQLPVQPQPVVNSNINTQQNINKTVVVKQPQQPVVKATQPKAEPPVVKKEVKAKPKKKNLPPLTNEYIKTLENYLNNQNTDIRLMGVKELMKKFKEGDSRKSDVALTALLNKALQDPSSKIRTVALLTMESGYASGDDLTVNVLKQIQNSKSAYDQDALAASQILLDMAGRKVNVSTESVEQPTVSKNQPGQRLNLVSS